MCFIAIKNDLVPTLDPDLAFDRESKCFLKGQFQDVFFTWVHESARRKFGILFSKFFLDRFGIKSDFSRLFGAVDNYINCVILVEDTAFHLPAIFEDILLHSGYCIVNDSYMAHVHFTDLCTYEYIH